MIKKVFSVFIVCLMFLTVSIGAFAVECSVSGTASFSKDENIIILGVNIENNPGLMGVHISVKYDENVLFSPSISRGKVLDGGMFNDSVATSPQGAFDVVWSGSENNTSNGQLFTVTFKVNNPTESTVIELSYVQEDTFNETYTDVMMKCQNVELDFNGLSNKATEKVSDISMTIKSDTVFNNEQLIESVQTVLDNSGISNIQSVPDEEKQAVLERINVMLTAISGVNSDYYDNFSTMENDFVEAVKEKYVNDVLLSVDSKNIEALIENSLDMMDVNDIDDVPSEKVEDFVKLIESGIGNYAPDVSPVSSKIGNDKIVEMICKLQAQNKQQKNSGIRINNKLLNICWLVGLVAVVVAIIIFVCKKKRFKHK